MSGNYPPGVNASMLPGYNVVEWSEELWCDNCQDMESHECMSEDKHEFEAQCVTCEKASTYEARDCHPY